MLLQKQDVDFGPGRPDPQYHPSRTAARDPACSPASGHLGRSHYYFQSSLKFGSSSTRNWKLPPYDARDDGSRVYFDELKLFPSSSMTKKPRAVKARGGIWTV